MQACRYGHWEVVQTLLVHRSNVWTLFSSLTFIFLYFFNICPLCFWGTKVTKADYLNGRTALHFAAVGGHVRCVRLVVADYVHSGFFQSGDYPGNDNTGNSSSSSSSSSSGLKYDHQYACFFPNHYFFF